MNRPNLFIIGAPRCGTTALSAYLGNHPSIFFSDPKEPHYFADDLPGHRQVKSLPGYLRLFEKAESQHKYLGEGSVFYLFSNTAVKNIYQFNPDARIIVMLRNPVDMVYSMHQQHLHCLYEDEEDFLKAWELQEQRAQGSSIPGLCRQKELLNYAKLASYPDQLKRVLSVFPPDQVKTILFDEFKTNTRGVYRETLEFLDLADDDRQEFPVVNEAKRLRSKLIATVIRKSPMTLRDLVTKLRYTRGLHVLPRAVDRVVKKDKKYKPMSSATRHRLVEYFREDILKLEEILDEDLQGWVK